MKHDVIIDHFSQLFLIEDEWENIHKKSSAQSPFSSFRYVLMWYETFVSENEVKVYRIQFLDETIGFMPLVLKYRKGFRELRNLFNDHCFNPQPLILKGYEQKFQELLLSELIKDKRRWDLVRNKFSYTFNLIPGLFSEKQLVNAQVKWTKNCEPTYTILFNKPFIEYFKNDVSKKMRHNLKKPMNMLSNADNHSFLHFQGSEAVEYWPLFLEIEGSGWKGSNGSSINRAGISVQQYYEKLLPILASTGDLHLYFLKVDDQIVSAVFGYTEFDLFHWSKIGYYEEFGQYSPSHLLLLHIIENLMTERPDIKRLHMFPWDYGYKHRFTNEESKCMDTIIYSPTVSGHLAYVLALAKKKVGEKLPEIIDQVNNQWKQLRSIKNNSSHAISIKEMHGD